jgi:hypothetical protein
MTRLWTVRRFAPVLLAVTLTFSATACNIGDDPVDDTEDQLEDKADEVEEDLRDATP